MYVISLKKKKKELTAASEERKRRQEPDSWTGMGPLSQLTDVPHRRKG